MDYGHYGHTRAGTLTHRLLSLEMELIEERETIYSVHCNETPSGQFIH